MGVERGPMRLGECQPPRPSRVPRILGGCPRQQQAPRRGPPMLSNGQPCSRRNSRPLANSRQRQRQMRRKSPPAEPSPHVARATSSVSGAKSSPSPIPLRDPGGQLPRAGGRLDVVSEDHRTVAHDVSSIGVAPAQRRSQVLPQSSTGLGAQQSGSFARAPSASCCFASVPTRTTMVCLPSRQW